MEYPTATARQGFPGSMPSLPIPVNDNRPPAQVLPFSKPYAAIEREVGKKVARSFAGLTAKALLRAIPVIGYGLLAWDLYNLYRMWADRKNVPFSFSGPGWTRVSGCPTYPVVAGHRGWNSCISGYAYELNSTFATRDTSPYFQGFGGTWRASFRDANLKDGADLQKFHVADVWQYSAPWSDPNPPPAEWNPPYVRPPRYLPNPAVQPAPVSPRPGKPTVPVVPAPHPSIDPFAWPVTYPAPYPRALPYWLLPYIGPNPWRSPTEQTTRGNGVDNPAPPNELPAEEPSFSIEPDGSIRPSSHPRARRVGPKEKERKMKMPMGAGFALRIVNFATEGVDFLDAFYDALPPDKKKKTKGGQIMRNVTPQEKARRLYKNFNDLDIPQALKNLAANQAEDAFYGKIGNKLKQASKAAQPHGNIPIGFGTGPLM